MEKAEVLFLVDYMDWARERMLAAVAGLTAEERHRELGGSFGSIQGVLRHLAWAEEAWRNRLYGTGGEPPQLEHFDDLRIHWAGVAAETRQWVAALPEGRVTARVEYLHRSGNRYATPAEVVVEHLANHQTYHRGQVAHLMRQLGREPVSTDLITYHRERPRPA